MPTLDCEFTIIEMLGHKAAIVRLDFTFTVTININVIVIFEFPESLVEGFMPRLKRFMASCRLQPGIVSPVAEVGDNESKQ